MTVDRKSELAAMCRLETRRTVTLAKMALADSGYHLAMPVFDVEFQAMLDRLEDKPISEHDIPTLMELVMEELWPRLREAHRKHRETLFGKLISRYNDIIARDAEFALDIGWIPLIREAVARMRTYPESWKVRVDGGKEKFGCLVLHVSFTVDERGAEPEVRRMREEIRLRSLATCDICGQQGRLRLGNYAKTVCDKHAAIFESFREDDGQHADPWRWRDEQPLEDHISAVLAKGRAIMASRSNKPKNTWTDVPDVGLLGGMDPPHDRSNEHLTDPLRATAIGRRIDDDTWKAAGREQELLIEFGGAIEDAVNGAVVKEQFLNDYIDTELDGWRTTAVVPVSARDREFLRGYLRGLIRDEYIRARDIGAGNDPSTL